MIDYYAIRWMDGVVRMLDQRFLPDEVIYREYKESNDIATAIREMVIRGAPAIGVAAGYGLALVAANSHAKDSKDLVYELESAAENLRNARPTAINLFWAIDRILHLARQDDTVDVDQLKQKVITEAVKITHEDEQMSLQMAHFGQQFIPDEANVIHHCNTGGLATAGIGTALGVIRLAHELGKKVHVFVDETRPRLQGTRLTAWELKQLGIPFTVIVDSSSGYIMKHYPIDACLVGCDRIASNGDIANKIGTYNLAIVAAAHHVPFYSVGPITTFDPSIHTGEEIPIEERPEDEITHIGKNRIAPQGVKVANPAFDITPAKYVSAIITDRGVAFPPYRKSLADLMNG